MSLFFRVAYIFIKKGEKERKKKERNKEYYVYVYKKRYVSPENNTAQKNMQFH